MTKPVTGPDGDNSITDEQIRELMHEAAEAGDHRTANLCADAIDRDGLGPDRTARELCAEKWNARHAKEDDRG